MDVKTFPSPAQNTTYHWLTFSFADCSVQGLYTERVTVLLLHEPGKLWVCIHSTKLCKELDGLRKLPHQNKNNNQKIKQTLLIRGTTLLWENVAIAMAIQSLIPLFRPNIPYCGYILHVSVIIPCSSHCVFMSCMSAPLNLRAPNTHNIFLKKNKLSIPAAPEFPFSPGTEESFSSLSGWNVSVLAL